LEILISVYVSAQCSDIITRLEKGDFALMAFLDLSAAFDAVDKSILINRLSRKFYIRETALEWFRLYLSGRGVKSPALTAEYDVPQGSVLGPLLFALYIADLDLVARRHCSVEGLEAHFYADNVRSAFSKPSDSTTVVLIELFSQGVTAEAL